MKIKTILALSIVPGIRGYMNEFHKNEEKRMSRKQTIERYGMQDGWDEARYEASINMSRIVDRNVEQVFIGCIELEKKGLVVLTEEKHEEEKL